MSLKFAQISEQITWIKIGSKAFILGDFIKKGEHGMKRMNWSIGVIFLSAMLLLNSPLVAATDLPPEAQNLLQEYDTFEAEVMKKAEAEIEPRRIKLFSDLEKIQEILTKSGNLDGAVAVRDKIKELKIAQQVKGKPILPDPGTLKGFTRAAPGDSLVFKVTGKATGGSVWGTDLYTSDSNLAMAAVHAGVLKEGQEGLVEVTFAPGQQGYIASNRNAVNSISWGDYPISYKIKAIAP